MYTRQLASRRPEIYPLCVSHCVETSARHPFAFVRMKPAYRFAWCMGPTFSPSSHLGQPISTKTKRFRVGISDCERAGPKACHGIHGAGSDCIHPSTALICSGESPAFDYPSCARRRAATVQLCMAVLRSVPLRAAGSRLKKEEKEVRCLPISLISFSVR
jgi:hypothetical protein